jgi:hypothetical protein
MTLPRSDRALRRAGATALAGGLALMAVFNVVPGAHPFSHRNYTTKGDDVAPHIRDRASWFQQSETGDLTEYAEELGRTVRKHHGLYLEVAGLVGGGERLVTYPGSLFEDEDREVPPSRDQQPRGAPPVEILDDRQFRAFTRAEVVVEEYDPVLDPGIARRFMDHSEPAGWLGSGHRYFVVADPGATADARLMVRGRAIFFVEETLL